MIESVTVRESLRGYDIVKATFGDFRQIARKCSRCPYNDFYFQKLLEYIQFMQTEEMFAAYYDDIQGKIDTELEKAGLNLTDIHKRFLRDAYDAVIHGEYF